EFMAMELNMSQSNYGRLEKDDNRLTVPKLLKIAKVLEVNISYLIGEKDANLFHHNNDDNVQSSIGTIYSDKDHIQSLKEEILFLRKRLTGGVKASFSSCNHSQLNFFLLSDNSLSLITGIFPSSSKKVSVTSLFLLFQSTVPRKTSAFEYHNF